MSRPEEKILKVEIPQDKANIKQQIKALESLILTDNFKDRKIHTGTLKDLKEALLYICYLEMQSKEFKEDIKGYEKFKEPGKDTCIKVNFTWGWLRVYRNKTNEIEWY